MTTPTRLTHHLGTAATGVSRLLIIRVSVRDTTKLRDNEGTGIRVYADVPGVSELGDLPAEIFDRSHPEVLERYGVVPLRYCDLAAGSDKRTVFGFFLSVGEGTTDRLGVLAVMDSAAEDNLPAPLDDLSGLGRNAFTEAVIELVVALDPTDVYVPSSSRWQRSERHAARLAEVFRRQGCRFWVEGRLRDLNDSSVRMMTTIDGGQNSAEASEFKVRTFEKKVERYQHGLWPRPESQLPPTHRLVRDERPDGRHFVAKGVTEVVPEYVTAIHAGMKAIIAGDSWETIASIVGDIPMRGTRSKGRMVSASRRKEHSARALFKDEFIEFWRTGVMPRKVTTSLVTDVVRGVPVEVDATTGQRSASVGIHLPTPEGGFPWTTEEIDALVAELARRDAAPRRGPGPTDRRRPLSGATRFRLPDDDHHEYRIISEGNSAYRIRRRPIQRRGWESGEGEHLATIYAPAMNRGLGQAIRDELRLIAEPLADVGPRSAVDDLAARRTQVLEERRKAEARLARIDEVVLDAESADDRRHWLERSGQLREEISRLEAKVAELDELEAARQERPADAVVPAVVAELLMRSSTLPGDPLLNTALERLGVLDTLRADAWDAETVHLSASLKMATTDGAPVVRHITWSCPNSKPGGPAHRRVRQQLRQFAEGATLDTLAEHAETTGDDLRLSLTRWLKDSGGLPSRGRRRAFVECPVAATRKTLCEVVLGTHEPEDPWAAHLEMAYRARGRWPQTWRRDSDRQRQVLATLLTQADPAEGITIADFAGILSVPTQSIRELAGPDRPLELRRFDVVALRPCPHDDCPGLEGHRFASVLIDTPETQPFGALCPDCGRLPDRTAALRFPAEYLHQDAAQQSLRRYQRLYSIGEAAEYLGVSADRLRAWTNDGLVETRGRRVLVGGPPGRVYLRKALDDAKPLVEQDLVRLDSQLVAPRVVADRLGIPTQQVYRLEDIGILTRHHECDTSGYLLDEVDAVPSDAVRLARGELVGVTAASRLVGLPAHMLDHAVRSGTLETVTVGSCRYVDPEKVALWAAVSFPEPAAIAGVGIREVADAAAVGTGVVRRLTDQGLVPCLGRVSGRRRYDLDEAVAAVRRHRPPR